MKHTHFVAFKTTLPDDFVENEDDEIVVYGGETVMRTFIEIIEHLGGKKDKIWSEGEQGWQANARYKSADLFLQVSYIDDFFLLIESSTRRSLFRKAPPPTDFNELVTKLADTLKSDPRFSDIQWSRDYDFEQKRGSDSPVFDS